MVENQATRGRSRASLFPHHPSEAQLMRSSGVVHALVHGIPIPYHTVLVLFQAWSQSTQFSVSGCRMGVPTPQADVSPSGGGATVGPHRGDFGLLGGQKRGRPQARQVGHPMEEWLSPVWTFANLFFVVPRNRSRARGVRKEF